MSTMYLNILDRQESHTIEEVDLETDTPNDLIKEAINCGVFDTSPGWSRRAVNNQTQTLFTNDDMSKTFQELGFKDGDTISFVYVPSISTA